MENIFHPLRELFAQLGLASDEKGIREFLAAHSPLDAKIPLADAPFWSGEQATFLRNVLLEDADWSVVVDQLDAALRASPADR